MICPQCGESCQFVFQLPLIVLKEKDGQEYQYRREGYKSDGKENNICLECLTFEIEEVL